MHWLMAWRMFSALYEWSHVSSLHSNSCQGMDILISSPAQSPLTVLESDGKNSSMVRAGPSVPMITHGMSSRSMCLPISCMCSKDDWHVNCPICSFRLPLHVRRRMYWNYSTTYIILAVHHEHHTSKYLVFIMSLEILQNPDDFSIEEGFLLLLQQPPVLVVTKTPGGSGNYKRYGR